MFAVIGGEATNEGLALRDTNLVIFGSATGGPPVMVAAPLGHSICRSRSSSGPTIHDEDQLHRAAWARCPLQASDDLTDRLAGMDALTNAVIKA